MDITIKQCMDNIGFWKNLPAYKAEPRVDWILALALPAYLEKKYNSKVQLLLPEFPIRKGTINSYVKKEQSNLSTKVDFYCLLEGNKHVLIEFKTDNNSINNDQLETLKKLTEIEVLTILDGIKILRNHSESKAKYDIYINALESANAYNTPKDISFEALYVAPNVSGVAGVNTLNLSELCNILEESNDEFIRSLGKVVSTW